MAPDPKVPKNPKAVNTVFATLSCGMVTAHESAAGLGTRFLPLGVYTLECVSSTWPKQKINFHLSKSSFLHPAATKTQLATQP